MAEHPTASTRCRTLRLQKLITPVPDAKMRDTLRKHHHDSENYSAMRRLDALSNLELCHGWLWHLNKDRGPLLSNEEFFEAVRLD